MKKYDKYKAVNFDYIDKLPEDWQLLPNIAVFENRNQKTTENEEGLSISAIKGIIRTSDYENRKDRTSDDKSEYLLVKEGDLAYNTMLMWAGAVGHSQFRGLVSPAYTVLRPKMEINSKYFHYLFRTEMYKSYSRRISYGIINSRLRLYYVNFKRMYSIVPPLATQNKIVAYIEKKEQLIDGLIQKKKRLSELLEEQKANKISKFYLNNSKNVKLKFLLKERLKYGANEEGNEINPKNPRYIRITDFDNSGTLRTDTFRSLPMQKAKEYFLNEGDILLARSGGTVGKAFQFKNFKGKACFAGYLIKASPDKRKVTSDYLYFFTKTSAYDVWKKSISNTATIENIGADKYANLLIPIVDLKEQQQIVQYIEQELEENKKAQMQISKEIVALEAYKESLIHSAVLGKIEVN